MRPSSLSMSAFTAANSADTSTCWALPSPSPPPSPSSPSALFSRSINSRSLATSPARFRRSSESFSVCVAMFMFSGEWASAAREFEQFEHVAAMPFRPLGYCFLVGGRRHDDGLRGRGGFHQCLRVARHGHDGKFDKLLLAEVDARPP